jgi:hypothetical protein
VVERLVANEKVASSTLVTRSSPESFRGWSERAEPMRRRAAPKKPSYGWQAGLRHVLRLPSQVRVVSETAIRRFNFQSEAAAQEAQRRPFSAYREVPSLDSCHLLRICERKDSQFL